MNAKVSALPDPPQLHVDLHEAVCALAEALSLVGIDEHQHGERVASMALECASHLQWPPEWRDVLFHAGLLHDCGVSSSRVHSHLIAEMDWQDSELHCLLGEFYLRNFAPLAHLAPIIRYHHTHWEKLWQLDLPQQCKLSSNLIFLVDRVDALRARLLSKGVNDAGEISRTIRQTIQTHSGSYFAPELVGAFLDKSTCDAFWLGLEPLNLMEKITQTQTAGKAVLTDYEDLRKLSRIFAHIVDAKSDYTYDHSLGVAELSRHLAQLGGVPEQRIAMIEIAALLHDLGKLGVPDEILEKPGALTAEEAQIMHRHSYDTFRILQQITGFEQIAEWAGNHHETLLGDGYPFHRTREELSFEARIIAVADIFQALAQDRPYREALPPQKILEILQTMGTEGRIDGDLVALVGANLATCYEAATASHRERLPGLEQ